MVGDVKGYGRGDLLDAVGGSTKSSQSKRTGRVFLFCRVFWCTLPEAPRCKHSASGAWTQPAPRFNRRITNYLRSQPGAVENVCLRKTNLNIETFTFRTQLNRWVSLQKKIQDEEPNHNFCVVTLQQLRVVEQGTTTKTKSL